MSSIAVYALGFLAQGFFSARMLIQWIMSERARKIVSPNIYWICSLAGSILLFIYGWLRNDFSIIFGQFIFTIRFIYQWYYSYRRHASYLPVGFWIISLVGSGIIVAYGVFRLDPVLIIGQSVGFITYTRNIMLGVKKK